MPLPSVHRSPSDFRYRVHDGEKFIAIYEPDEEHLADAHLQRILPKRRARAVVAVPGEVVLELQDAPVRRSSATQVEDSERVHVAEFSDGFRVWHPVLRTFLAGPDGAYPRREDALARARDVMVQIGAGKAPARARKAPSPAPMGGLFAPAEMAAKGQQIGFKFNSRRATSTWGGRLLRPGEMPMGEQRARAVDALSRIAKAVIEEPEAFDDYLAAAARARDIWLLVDRIAIREANALRDTKRRGGYTHWSRVIGGYGPFQDQWRGEAIDRVEEWLKRREPKGNGRKTNGAQQPWGRRFERAQLGTFDDLMPIGREVDDEDLAPRRHRSVAEQYEALAALAARKPNGHYTPSAEELAALRAFASAHGRNWKAELRRQWMNASASPVLMRVRNAGGPRFLQTFSLEASRKPNGHYTPSAEELAALRAFASAHGRNWKSELRRQWMNASASPVLMRVRNAGGPRFLQTFSLEASRPDVVEASYRFGPGAHGVIHTGPSGVRADVYAYVDVFDTQGRPLGGGLALATFVDGEHGLLWVQSDAEEREGVPMRGTLYTKAKWRTRGERDQAVVDTRKPNAHAQVVEAKTTRQRVRGAELRRRFLLVRQSNKFAWVEVNPSGWVVGFVDAPRADAETSVNAGRISFDDASHAVSAYAAKHRGVW